MSQIDLGNAHKIIGGKLRRIREATKKSINEAAKEAGVSPKTLLKIENGQVNFRILTLGKLCKAYNVSLEKLLEGFNFGPPK